MALRLRPMEPTEFSAYLGPQRDGYVAERVLSGETPEQAAGNADTQLAQLFPGGRPGPDQYVFVAEDGGQKVGTLWIGHRPGDRPGALWVYDVEILEQHRGRGMGRAVMLAAEREAAARGADELGLNVFGHNETAWRLYQSLGYRTTAAQMAKALRPVDLDGDRGA